MVKTEFAKHSRLNVQFQFLIVTDCKTGPHLKWLFVVLRQRQRFFSENFFTALFRKFHLYRAHCKQRWTKTEDARENIISSTTQQTFSHVRRLRLEPIAVRNHMPKSPRSQPHQSWRSVLAIVINVGDETLKVVFFECFPFVFKIGAMFILTAK